MPIPHRAVSEVEGRPGDDDGKKLRDVESIGQWVFRGY
jgi:hypothetical protein